MKFASLALVATVAAVTEEEMQVFSLAQTVTDGLQEIVNAANFEVELAEKKKQGKKRNSKRSKRSKKGNKKGVKKQEQGKNGGNRRGLA